MQRSKSKKAGAKRTKKQGWKTARSSPIPTRVKVGRPWREKLDLSVEGSCERSEQRKDMVNLILTVTFLLLLCALAVYAMTVGDQAMLSEILKITSYGLAFVAVWAGGRAALKVMSGWKPPE
jgi:hypothetical protein